MSPEVEIKALAGPMNKEQAKVSVYFLFVLINIDD